MSICNQQTGLVPKTPLENWIGNRIGLGSGSGLTRRAMDAYQLRKLKETLSYVKEKSPFYKDVMGHLPIHSISTLDDMAALPFTRADDIRSAPFQFLCLSQDEIARVVTLETSGTTFKPKRAFFTEADLELTIDFYHHGMSALVAPGNRVLILMPGKTPFSVGDLLVRALSRMGVEGIVHGPVHDAGAALQAIMSHEIDCLVGIPIQVFAMAKDAGIRRIPPGRLKSILLSADYVSNALLQTLSGQFHCPVFQHYGMTETGLAGGVECAALAGYHPREADLYYEIVDPDTGQPVQEGETGEVVVTTLTQRAMPLIRYRTGDLSRFIPEPCPCGTVLRRLARIQGRIDGRIPITQSLSLSMPLLDDAVLAVPDVLNYEARLDRDRGTPRLLITAHTTPGTDPGIPREIREAVLGLPGMRHVLFKGHLSLEIHLSSDEPAVSTGPQKRRLSVGKD